MSRNQDEFAMVYSLAKDELRQKRLNLRANNLRENNSSSRQILIKKLILVIKNSNFYYNQDYLLTAKVSKV